MVSRKLLKSLGTSLLIASIIILPIAGVIGYTAFIRKPYIIKERTLYSVMRKSEYSLKFKLAPNEVFGELIDYNPKIPMYLSIVKVIHVNYSLKYLNATASGNLNISVRVVHPDGWSKTYMTFSEPFKNSQYITKGLDLNLSKLVKFMSNLTSELGLKLSSFDIAIDALVKPKLKVGSRIIMDPFIHSITLTVDKPSNRIIVKGNLSSTATISKKIKSVEESRIMGLNINTLRLVSMILMVLGVSCLTSAMLITMRIKSFDMIKRFEKKYSDIIVSTDNIPVGSNIMAVSLSDLDELVKLAKLLERPILKLQSNKEDELQYFIVDRDVMYVVKIGKNLP